MTNDDREPTTLPAVAGSERSIIVSKAISAGFLGAGSALIGVVNPALGIIAGGLAPMVQASIDELITRRSLRLRTHLDANGIDLEQLGEGDAVLTDDQLLLLQEAISAALGTDRDEKVAVIIRLLKFGLQSAAEVDVLAARRFARTVSRLDEVELRAILALNAMNGGTAKPSLPSIAEKSRLSNADLVRSAMSSLEGEGLVKLLPGAIETWAISDFGRRLVLELTQVFREKE